MSKPTPLSGAAKICLPPAPPAHALAHPTEWRDPATDFVVFKDVDANIEQRKQWAISCKASEKIRKEFVEMCKASILFWINMFVWTYNVKTVDADGAERPAEFPHVPFVTWPVQDEAVTTICRCIDAGSDLIEDKSRDMGASWLNVAVAGWYWLFKPELPIMLVSRVEDLVDRQGDPDCLFWKLDYINANLPDWMLPPAHPTAFQRGGEFRSHMHLGRPDAPASIDGQATTAHIGRGGRRRFILFDEMAAIEQATDAWRSAADTTACRIGNSTPIGPGTEFTKQRNKGLMTGDPVVVTLGYWDHPQKGQGRDWRVDTDGSVTGIAERGYWWTPWFAQQCKRRDTTDIGQNILIDHVTSGNLFFNSAVVTQHAQQYAVDPRRCELAKNDKGEWAFIGAVNGRWYLYGAIPENENFVMFADPSYGKGAANSTVAVLACGSGRIVAEFADPYCAPVELSKEMILAGKGPFKGQTGRAFIGWEVNGPGEAMYLEFKDYPAVYFQREVGKLVDRRSLQYGWRSDDRGKRLLCTSLATALTRSHIIVPSRPALNEMLEYVFFENGSIGPGQLRDELTGARAAHGDRVIAVAGCVFLRGEMPKFRMDEKKLPPDSLASILGMEQVLSRKVIFGNEDA